MGTDASQGASTSDSSEGLELRSTHFCQENKRSYTPKPIGPTDKKIPSKQLNNLKPSTSIIIYCYNPLEEEKEIVPLQNTILINLQRCKKSFEGPQIRYKH